VFAVECEVVASEHGIKNGTKSATFIEWLPTPVISTSQRLAFGILSALCVWRAPEFVDWSENWLTGKCRTSAAAIAVWYVSPRSPDSAAARAAAYAVACVSSWDPARGVTCADHIAEAARAAAAAASAAAAAASAAHVADAEPLNLVEIAKEAMSY
jgi:hypothetical protein